MSRGLHSLRAWLTMPLFWVPYRPQKDIRVLILQVAGPVIPDPPVTNYGEYFLPGPAQGLRLLLSLISHHSERLHLKVLHQVPIGLYLLCFLDGHTRVTYGLPLVVAKTIDSIELSNLSAHHSPFTGLAVNVEPLAVRIPLLLSLLP